MADSGVDAQAPEDAAERPSDTAQSDVSPPPTHSALNGGQMSHCPNEFLCPITGGLMRDPVLLVATGHTFERAAIQAWFQQCRAEGKLLTCPLTRATLSSTQVSPNVTLRKLIQDWAARHPTESAVRTADSQPLISAVPVPLGVILPPGASSEDSDPIILQPLIRQDTPGVFAPTRSRFDVQTTGGPAPRPAESPRTTENRRRIVAQLEALELRTQRGQLIGLRSPSTAGSYELGATLPAADDDEPLESEPQESDADADPATDAPPTLRFAPDFETVGTAPQEMLILAHVAAPETSRRVPIDMVAVLDVSSSMGGARFALLMQTMDFVISQLEPSDRLSIVAFSQRARVAVKLTRATDVAKERIREAMFGLRTQGGTSILSGLKLGLHVLTSRRQSNPVACMFLLSDGQDTSGLDNYEGRRRELTSAAAAGNVPVHTFGYGSDHDERILDSISAGTNGTFSYLRGETGMKEAVAQFLGGAVSVAFQATTVHLNAASGVAIDSVSAGVYEATVDEEHVSASVALKDLYAGETRDFLVKVKLPAADDRLVATELLTGKIEYKLPGREEVHRSPSVTVSVARGESPEGTESNVEVDLQRNRLDATSSMRDADRLAETGRLEEARDRISSAIETISGSTSAALPACVGVLDDLRGVARGLASANEYRTQGSKVVKSVSRMHASQRAAYTSSGEFPPMSGPRQPTVSPYASRRATEMRSLSSGPDAFWSK